MPSLVTKLDNAKKYRCHTRKFHNTLRWLKQHAHRVDRRACKQALKNGREYFTIPRLTGWDIV